MSLETGLMCSLMIVVATALALTGFALWLRYSDDRQKNGGRT
ncbi:hypothetical protein OKW30_003554 [Paraburkholderia sp. Clong3]